MSPERKIPLTKLSEAILPYQASVYVTVLNIIQCIAFGFLVIEGKAMAEKNELNLVSALRIVVIFATILFIWHRYTTEFQYLWPRSFVDTSIPYSMGLAECLVVFTVNVKTASMTQFVASIMLVQVCGIVAYFNAYFKRDKKFMHKLYEDFYQDPIFTSFLIEFLKKYDRDHAARMFVALIASLLFCIVAKFWPSNAVEIIFALMCIGVLYVRAFFHSFEVYIDKDPNLKPYFQ